MASTLENNLLKIHSKVKIRDEDRKPYTDIWHAIEKWLLAEMSDIDPVFGKLCKGTCLFGSFSNQVRIIKPSEFDVFILFQFPFSITITLLEGNPGFARLDFGKTLEFLNNDVNYRVVYNKFMEFTDVIKNEICLNRTRFQLWIKELINKVIHTRPHPVGYSIEFKKLCVAQNMCIQELCSGRKISIDFVPGIKVGEQDKLRKQPFIKFEDFRKNNFIVVPKPIPGKTKYVRISGEHSFQMVNSKAEKEMLWDKQNLKVVYRLLKSLRDHYKLKRMKSYFLTAIFLLEIQNQKDDFWGKSVDFLFIHMLQKLVYYFSNRKLPYFWIKRFNLLNILNPKEITKYAAVLNKICSTFISYQKRNNLSYDEVVSHFKTRYDKK